MNNPKELEFRTFYVGWYGEDNDVKIIGYDDANITLGTIYVSEWNSCKDEQK